MGNVNSNILLIILAIIIIVGIIYYFNRNKNTVSYEGYNKVDSPNSPKKKNNKKYRSDEISDSVMDELLVGFDVDEKSKKKSNKKKSTFSPADPAASCYGTYIPDDQLNSDSDSENSANDKNFTHKKKKYTKRTPEDIKDLFDVDKMLPNEVEEKWFDTQPLLCTKKIKGANLIHPKVHMGQNTISSTLKNATLDIRGDIPNPKVGFYPWNNSTIEYDDNLRGFGN